MMTTQTTEAQTYNGWTNYETWLVNLWMDKWADEFVRIATELREEGYSLNRIQQHLTSTLRDDVEQLCTVESGSLAYDLMKAALDSVDWVEIVENWTNHVFTTPENVTCEK